MGAPKKYHTDEARLEAKRAAKRAYYARNKEFCNGLTMAAQARDRAKNPEKYRQKGREYYRRPEAHAKRIAASRLYFQVNRQAVLARNREAKLRERYGVGSYESLYRKQGGRCAICRSSKPRTSGTRFAVDHDHDTGKVRGLLCGPCNSGLGGLQDSPELLTAAIRYLRNASQLELGLELRDQMSGPAKQIVINLSAVVKATDDTKKAAESASHSIRDMAIGTGIEHLAEKVFELGKTFVEAVLEQHAYAEKTKIAFEVLTGSVEKANEVFEESQRVAMAIARPAEEVGAAYKALMLAGESPENLQLVTKAAAGLAALGGGSIQSWAQAFADIKSKGELAGRSLMQFKGVLDFDVLAKKLGFATHGFKALAAQLNTAPVSAHKGIEALLQAIAAKEGGVIETVSQKLANTFTGTLATIKDELMDLFEFDSSDSPILEFLHGVRDALKPGGPLVMGIREGAAAFMEGLGVFSGPGGFDGFVKSLKDGTVLGKDFKATMRAVGEDVRAVVELTVDLGKALGTVARGLAEIRRPGSAVERIASTPGVELTAEARAAIRAMDVAKAGGSVGVGQPLEDLRFQAGESVGMKGSMRSSIPHFALGGRVTGPTLALIGEGGEPETVVPDSKMGGMGARINLNLEQHFHVHGGGEAPVRKRLAGDLHALGVGDFQGAMDTLASMLGAH